MESLIGTTIGGYKLTRPLGSGPTGQVMAAVDSIGSPSAIKLLHPVLSLFTKVESYWDEVQRVGALSHPHITAATAADWSRAGRFFLATDLLEGIDLHQALAAGRLPPSQTLLFAGQLCLALEAAHEIGAVHGALKPHNIFLVPKSGDPAAFSTRVMDFGTCQLVNTSAVPSSAPGTAGAPEAAYLAPEQFKGELSPASDIYALGVILYEALSGRRPFVGSHEQLAVAHNKTAPPPPTGVPAGLSAIILKALAKAPAARYASVAELREAIEDWAAKSPPELETPGIVLFPKKAGAPGVAQGEPEEAEAESTVKVPLAELSMAVEEQSVPEAILARPLPASTAPTKKAEEPKKVAEPKKPAAAPSDAKVPHDAELAAIAAKAAVALKPEKRPAADEKRTPLAAVAAPQPAKQEPAEGYFDEDGDFVELPLEKSVKAFVATLAPVVPPPTTKTRAGGNGESLDAALDQFVRDAKAWSSALPKPMIDDKRLAALAKVPEPEPPPAPKPAPKPVEPARPAARLEAQPAQPRSVLLPSILSFVLGGAVIFGVVWFLGFGPKRGGGETGTQEPGSAATKPDDKKAVTPVAGPISDGAPPVAAKPLEAGAPASMAAKPADAGPAAAATPDAAPAAAAPDAGAVTPAPKVAKVKKVRKVRKAIKKAAVVKKVEKPEPKAKKAKKGKKEGSDWVDPFSQ